MNEAAVKGSDLVDEVNLMYGCARREINAAIKKALDEGRRFQNVGQSIAPWQIFMAAAIDIANSDDCIDDIRFHSFYATRDDWNRMVGHGQLLIRLKTIPKAD